MLRTKENFKLLLVAIMIAVLAVPYAQGLNFCSIIENENHKHNHFSLYGFPSWESSHLANADFEQRHDHVCSHDFFSHRTDTDCFAKILNHKQNLAGWHCQATIVHISILPDLLTEENEPDNSKRQNSPSHLNANISSTSTAYLPKVTSVAWQPSASGQKDFISTSTDLPPPLV